MTSKYRVGLAAIAVALLGLTACSPGGDGTPTDEGTSGGGYGAPASPDDSNAVTGDAGLRTTETDLGTIVVDGDGMTLYPFR